MYIDKCILIDTHTYKIQRENQSNIDGCIYRLLNIKIILVINKYIVV